MRPICINGAYAGTSNSTCGRYSLEFLLILLLVAVVAVFVSRNRTRRLTYAVDEPISTEGLRNIHGDARALLVDADIIVRDYMRVRQRGQITTTFRSRSDLRNSVSAIKSSIILVVAYKASRASDPKSIIREMREAYQELAFFPPTDAEAIQEWGESSRDRDATLQAGRSFYPERTTLSGAMIESGRLAAEFDQEVLAFASPDSNKTDG